MSRKILFERVIPGKFHGITYSDGFTHITYVNGVKKCMQEWDQFGKLKSITTYKDGCLESHTVYDLILGCKKSEMRVLDGVKTTIFYKNGKEDFSLMEYPDGHISCVSHQKVKKQTKLKLLSLLQKSRS